MRRLLLLAVLVLFVVGLALGVVAYRVLSPYKGYGATEQLVEIPPGTAPAAIGDRLVESGVVRDRLAFQLAWRLGARAGSLKAGEYRFHEPMSAVAVVDRLVRGGVHMRPLTLPEGLTILDMAQLFEDNDFGRAEDFLEAASDPTLVQDLDPDAEDLEGYLFPDTYRLPRRANARALVRQMVARFREVLDEVTGEQGAPDERSVRELVTLASIIEKETGHAEERALVAAVFANRLDVGMGLQSDPTVIYALRKAGRYDGNLTRKDLRVDSPYNTYRYPGLPPGPIAAPGRAALSAALEPAVVDYLFFVSRNDGSHAFARTLREHNRNVQQYQVRYFRERRNQ